MKKNILFVVDERKMGGVSVLLNDILRTININKYHIDVMVLHNNGDYLDDLDKKINLIYGTPFFEVIDYSLKEILKSKNIIKIFRKMYLVYLMKTKKIGKKIIKERKKCLDKQYDVEIAFKDGFTALFTAYGDSKKKYHWLHTDYSMYDCTEHYSDLFAEVFLMFDKIIGISENVLKKFREKYEVSKTDVIYNLIDAEKIKEKSLLEHIEYDTNKINLISIGRIHQMKGYDRLVEVVNKLNLDGKFNNVVLRLVGEGPDFDFVKSLVIKYHLEDKVLLLGKKKNPFPYVKASDMFLMCSRYEPLGLVVLEAFVLGVPVLSQEVLSIHEIMTSKEGLIVPNSEEGLYNGLLKIIENKKILDNYKNNLKDFVYNINDIVTKIEYLLGEE